MIEAHNRERALEWLEKAEHDLVILVVGLKAPEVSADVLCFHAQQVVEKSLKGGMVAHGVEPPRIHALLPLFDVMLPFVGEIADLRSSMADITGYAVSSRYPGDFSNPDRVDAESAVEVAKRVFEVLGNHIRNTL